MAHRPHLDRNTYFVGQTVNQWNNLGKIKRQIERIGFVTEGDVGKTALLETQLGRKMNI